MQRSLGTLASKLAETRSVRDGDVVLRLSGEGAGTYLLSSQNRNVQVVDAAEAGLGRPPLIEVIGDAETVQSILEGEVDAREKFLAGGLRVRGDLRYLSDVALELGLLKKPL